MVYTIEARTKAVGLLYMTKLGLELDNKGFAYLINIP